MWLADRFLRLRDDTWLDLATNARVVPIERALGAETMAAWLSRCARLAGLWHSHLVSLVDYVPLGDDRGVEVYDDHRALSTSPRGAQAIVDGVACFLREHGLRTGPLDRAAWAACAGRPSLVPPSETCGETPAIDDRQPARVRRHPAMPVRTIGLRLDTPEALGAVRAALDDPGDERTVLVHAARRAGATTLLRLAAREARLHGFCPVCPAAIRGRAVLEGLSGRRVALLCDVEVPAARLSSALAALWRHHIDVAVTVRVTLDAWREARAITMRAWPPAKLATAVCLSPHRALSLRSRLAAGAQGHPGRLADQWLGGADRSEVPNLVPPAPRPLVSPGANWGATAEPRGSMAADCGPWPRDRRAAPAAVLGAPWHALEAGRAHEASRLFAACLDRGPGNGEPPLISAWCGLGLAELDAGRLERASAALERAWAFSGLLCPHDGCDWSHRAAERARSRLALVRCRLWQGRVVEAARLLSEVEDNAYVGPLAVRLARYQARDSWRRGAFPDAWRALARAASHAADLDEHAAIACDRARLALGCGDSRGLRPRARRGRPGRAAPTTVAARRRHSRGAPDGRARAPRARRARPPGRATGTPGCSPAHSPARAARARARRPAAHAGGRRVRGSMGRGDARARRMGAAGRGPEGRSHGEGSASRVGNLPGLDRRAAGARRGLRGRCATVSAPRSCRSTARRSNAGAWRRPARRASTVPNSRDGRSTRDVVLQPTPVADGVEAAAPVVYAGQRIGALTCRWTMDAPVDPREAHTLLLGAATALAPHVQGLNDVAVKGARRGPDTLGLLGASGPIIELRERIRRVSGAPFHVLIEGESGSGKELVARALHVSGPRAARRFCAVNCAALTDDLFEAELFGHVRGAFTGAVGERAGLFEDADGGTLFLDEVGELSLRAQAKLLRAIQDGEIRRVGESLPRRVDARIVAATNRALAEEADAGRFRADLLYRLDVIRITVPPLRDRPEDIVVIARSSWTEAAGRVGSRATLHVDTLTALARYHWPGNVRELQNVVRALAVNAPPRGVVGPSRLPGAIAVAGGVAAGQTLDRLADRSRNGSCARLSRARAIGRGGRRAIWD